MIKLIYNAQGQLAQLRDANAVVIATYVYRGDGKRAWKELANGTRSYFYYAGEQLIAGTNGVDASGLQLWGADGLVGSRSFNSTTNVVSKSYNLYDTQGNLAQTLDAATGNVTGQSALSAWGEPIRDAAGHASGAGYGAKFGYVQDGESGFYLCTLRYYAPSAGRWITRDPIGYNGGSNLYGYVGNDPVNMADISGLYPKRKDGIAHIFVGDLDGGGDWQSKGNDAIMRSNASMFEIPDFRAAFYGYEKIVVHPRATAQEFIDALKDPKTQAIGYYGHGTKSGSFSTFQRYLGLKEISDIMSRRKKLKEAYLHVCGVGSPAMKEALVGKTGKFYGTTDYYVRIGRIHWLQPWTHDSKKGAKNYKKGVSFNKGK